MAGGAVSTTIRFDDRDVHLDERTLLATADYRLIPTIGLQLGVGAILDGNVRVGDVDNDIGTGVAATVAASWLALPEREIRPFVLAALSVGVSTTTAGDNRLTAVDARFSLVVGKTFWNAFTPYAVGRVFGGPVHWRIAGESVTGGDTHHYAVGAGATVRIGQLDLFAEGLPLGERAVNIGVGWSL